MPYFQIPGGDVFFVESGREPPAGAVPFAEPVPTLQDLASKAMEQVNAEYTRHAKALVDPFPEIEQKSWPRQEKEAEALMAQGESATTAWIDAAAARRGITRMEMAEKILRKAALFAAVSGNLSGVRQNHEDQIEALLAAGEESREALQNYWYLEGWEVEPTTDLQTPRPA